MDKITVLGEVKDNGTHGTYQKELLNNFLSKHKGARTLLTIEVIPDDTTQAQMYKLKKVILPAMAEGFVDFGYDTSEADVERFIQKESRIDFSQGYNKQNVSRLIDFCIRYSAENLHKVIE